MQLCASNFDAMVWGRTTRGDDILAIYCAVHGAYVMQWLVIYDV